MSKLAFSTVACMDAQAEQIIKCSLKYGIQGIEIRLDQQNRVMGIESEERLKLLKKQLQYAGICVTNLGSSICIKEYQKQHTECLKQLLMAAEILECKGIRVFLGNFSSKINKELPKPDYEGIVRQLREMCREASEYRKEIWVETHNEFATGAVLKRLMEDVNCENLKVIWDIMHPLEDGEDIAETWEAIGSRIAHVHIKDGFDRKDSTWHDYYYTCLGEGSIPIEGILRLLEKKGYDGFLSFEWEALWRTELKKYDSSLDWVLKQYTDYIKLCQKNIFTRPVEQWMRTDASGKGRTENFSVYSDAGEACIDNREVNACLKKYSIEAVIEPGKAYHLTVPYRAFEINSKNLVYGMLTLYDGDGVMTRRLYLEEAVNECKELTFQSASETRLQLDLGIKRYGKVSFYYPLLSEAAGRCARRVKAASVFIKVKPELSYDEHLERIAEGIDRAAASGIDLIGLAENLNTRVKVIPEDEQFGTLSGRYCTMLKKKAKEHQCYLFFSFRAMDEKGVRRNKAVLLNRDGEVVGTYDKTHITITEYEAGMVPGDCYPVFDTDFGRVGLLVCWDTYFPGPARAMAQQGAEILLVPTAGNPTYRHIARAKENGVYMVVACFSESVDSGIASAKIVDPCGEILAHTREDGEAAAAEIDLNEEKYIFWLSVGPANAIPSNIYRNEVRDDLKDMMNISEEEVQ